MLERKTGRTIFCGRCETSEFGSPYHQDGTYRKSLSLVGHLSQQLIRCLTQPFGKYDCE
jgi:hypothetical protein